VIAGASAARRGMVGSGRAKSKERRSESGSRDGRGEDVGWGEERGGGGGGELEGGHSCVKVVG
jgi:hypothetical protein